MSRGYELWVASNAYEMSKAAIWRPGERLFEADALSRLFQKSHLT